MPEAQQKPGSGTSLGLLQLSALATCLEPSTGAWNMM